MLLALPPWHVRQANVGFHHQNLTCWGITCTLGWPHIGRAHASSVRTLARRNCAAWASLYTSMRYLYTVQRESRARVEFHERPTAARGARLVLCFLLNCKLTSLGIWEFFIQLKKENTWQFFYLSGHFFNFRAFKTTIWILWSLYTNVT